MNVVVSCHLDTCFADPFLRWHGKVVKGACDNFALVLATGMLLKSMKDRVMIEWTEREELDMMGARAIAKRHKQEDSLFVVLDVTDSIRPIGTPCFTIENVHRVETKHIRSALSTLNGRYRFISGGTESEAWLYKDLGFAVIEIDLPVKGGLHSLDTTARLEDIELIAQAIEKIVEYFSPKNLREVCPETE